MLSRDLQQQLFGQLVQHYDPAPDSVLHELEKHGINIHRDQSADGPIHLPLPDLSGDNIAEHMKFISEELTAPYSILLESLANSSPFPPMPTKWRVEYGWTKYHAEKASPVPVPEDDIMILDTEVLMNEGDMPTIAVALSPNGWYSWVSPYLQNDHAPPSDSLEPLVPLYGNLIPLDRRKCVIGHFVGYDRARLREEYLPQGTGTRFLDTLSLHVAISGLTSTQRHLKTTAKKHNFNNKLWKNFMQDHGEDPNTSGLEDKFTDMDLQWISETSLNNLTDVYQLYCGKKPLQTKEARSVFESGTKQEVRSQFQELMTYCATDVLMTCEVFQNLMPLFKSRFPHLATLHGLLEMGSMYLPINRSWLKFQQNAESVFEENKLRQKQLLMQLADEALKRYSQPGSNPQNDPWLWDLDWSRAKMSKPKTDSEKKLATLPKWYRELIPKPVKDNVDTGPALVTAQMRLAPKLLRLCWQGLPLHYDQVLKWGVLIPGKAPQPLGDPRYYETNAADACGPTAESTCSEARSHQIRPQIPVHKEIASGRVEYKFPYKAYLSYWTSEMKRRFSADLESTSSKSNSKLNSDFGTSFRERVMPSLRDDQLLDELDRSIQAMPLQLEERMRLSRALQVIRQFGSDSTQKEKSTTDSTLVRCEPVHRHLGEMQVRGSAFWMDAKRYDRSNSSNGSSTKMHRTQRSRAVAVSTVNPVIPTCWFNHLPHDSGEGRPVGSPLSKSFQPHITSSRLHSAHGIESTTGETAVDIASAGLATQLLRDRIHATFWQSYSKRIKDQMYIWLPYSDLPDAVTQSDRYDVNEQCGAILPQVIVAGTISRRAVEPLWLTASNADASRLGSEIKAMIQAPPGFCFVGADVDSQEMWIASLIGDASLGFQGSTPYGWMTLEGSKTDGTDLHTKIAKIMGITRNEAKVLNYARLYGSGFEFTKHILAKFSHCSPEQASLKANELIRTTKGCRVATKQNSRTSFGNSNNYGTRWQGGTESAVFNQLEEIARSPEPRTPVLKAQLTRALNPKLVKDDFLPSRINWVVQSSAVDYLHCMLLVMSWLIQTYKLPARLCISIHDEVRYLCREDAADRVALALQISNLFTRAFFAHQLGMRDLPESVAFFSSVEIDRCLRKNPDDDCLTPSNPDGLQKSYNVTPGTSLLLEDILRKTNGQLSL